MAIEWIDVHTHLDMLEGDPNSFIESARKNSVHRMITVGTGHDDLQKVIDAAQKLSPIVFGTLGFHPHDASTYNLDGENFILKHGQNDRIVAIGEIGLDYHYSRSPHDVQQKVFRRQMEIARELKLPVEIHTRDAEADTLQILSEFKGEVQGLIHCFTGTEFLAKGALDLGYNISLSGVVTYKKSQALRDVVEKLPLDRIHIETDAPFLAPEPFRGRKNEPSLIIHTAQFLSSQFKVSLEHLSETTKKNALKLFPKLQWS